MLSEWSGRSWWTERASRSLRPSPWIWHPARVRKAAPRPNPSQRRGHDRPRPASPNEIESRIERAEKALGEGYPPATVVQRLMANEPGLSKNAATSAVQKAMVAMHETVASQLPFYRGLVVHRLQLQIAASMQAKRFRDAIAGESELAKILGLRAPLRMQVSTDGAVQDAVAKVMSGMSAEERERIVEEQRELELAAGRARLNGHGHGGFDG